MLEEESLEVNLGKYVDVLIRQWQLILLLAVLFTAGSAFLASRQPKVYRANVIVVSTKIASSVSFTDSIETLTEEQLGYRLGSTAARLQSYVQLVRNPIIANKVIEKLKEKLPKNERDVLKLMGRVQGNVVEKSDSIQISVTHPDAELAALIANAWGAAFVDHVNFVYSGGGVSASYLAVKEQKAEAFKNYEKVQADLVAFISDNQVQELSRQILEQQSVIDNLSASRGLMVNTIVSDTMTSQLSVFNQRVQNLEEKLALAYENSRKVDQWMKYAQDMREQVINGGPGAASSNYIALILLKAQIFAAPISSKEISQELDGTITSSVPSSLQSSIQLQAGPANISAEDMAADLESLIRILEFRRDALRDEIQAVAEQLLESKNDITALGLNASGDANQTIVEGQASVESFADLTGIKEVLEIDLEGTTIEQKIKTLEDHVNKLESQAAFETGREQELTRARDLAWETYSTLSTKEAELKVASQTRGTEVILGATAAVPEKAISTGSRDIVLATAIGAVLGIGAAFLFEFWRKYRGLEPIPIAWIRLPRIK